MRELADGAFDLATDSPLRAGLVRLGERGQRARHDAAPHRRRRLVASACSIASSSISTRRSSAACPPTLAPLPLQYSDFSEWQRDALRGSGARRARSPTGAGSSPTLPTLELPTDRPRPSQASFRGRKERGRHSGDRSPTALKDLARKHNATLYMTLLAAFQVLLMRYSGQDDVAVGSPIAGRGRPEIDGLIGFFVNTLVMRGDLSGNPRVHRAAAAHARARDRRVRAPGPAVREARRRAESRARSPPQSAVPGDVHAAGRATNPICGCPDSSSRACRTRPSRRNST